MKRLWVFRVWHGVVSVPVAAGVGVVTNLATDEFSWALSSALVALVLVQAGLSVWQAVADQQDRRDARDELLGSLRPPVPPSPVSDKFPAERDGPVLGVGAVVEWVTAPFTPTPLWARSGVRDRLVAWCAASGSGADVVRVVTGPVGVGKSRLALAVAEALPAGWVTGRLLDDAAGLVERIADAGDRTLVIVDDAERVAVSAVETLVIGAMRHPDLIRVLLLARTDSALRLLSDEVRPRLAGVEVLGPVGEAGDRQRWFAEAARAYARVWRVPAPDLPDRPVGADGDTPLVLHARALLAVLGRSGIRTWSLTDLMTELVSLEQRSWQSDLPRLPAGCDTEVLGEALAVLLLLPASGTEEAAELLRRVPQFSHDTAQESRVAVARWARRRYPPAPDHRLGLQPHLAGERLVLDTLTRTPNLLHDEDIPAAASVLAFAYASFPDALQHLTSLLTRRVGCLPEVLSAVLVAEVTGPLLDRALAALIDTRLDDDTRARLIPIAPPAAFPHVRLSLSRILVVHQRHLTEIEPGLHRPDLAIALISLSDSLRELGWYREAFDAAGEAVQMWRQLVESEHNLYRPVLALALRTLGANLAELGRHREALDATEEAVLAWRQLAETEPDQNRQHLADALNGLGASLQELGRHREALDATEEAVLAWRQLAETEPDQYRMELAKSLNNLGIPLWELRRHREAIDAAEEAVEIWWQLVETDPDQYRGALANALHNLGVNLQESGRDREAVGTLEGAVQIWRQLVEAHPDRYRHDLARSLHSLGINLRELGRYHEAFDSTEETLRIRRQLAKTEPHWHRPELANALLGHGNSLRDLDRSHEALRLLEGAVQIWRQLVEAHPDQYRHGLARSLHSLGNNLSRLARYHDALNPFGEALRIHRQLTETDPDRYRPDLAVSLQSLGEMLRMTEDAKGALSAFGEALTVWRACAEQDPQQYAARYQLELVRLRKNLDLQGRHDEAAALDLDASRRLPGQDGE